MYRFFALVLFLIAFSGLTAAQSNGRSYDDLLNKLKSGDTSIDFKVLRFAFADKTSPPQRSADAKTRGEMVKLYNEKKYKEAIKISEEILKVAFVDINAQMVTSMSYSNLGDDKKAKFHESVYVGLINSIISGGDGNSAKTAYHIISLAEESAVLAALELKHTGQSMHDEAGSKYHVLAVTDKAAADAGRVYFNIDAMVKGAGATPAAGGVVVKKP